ncbi:MAG: hypothetical protein ABSD71_03225 [Bacteroidales bacterium]|jgi:hypothetical protein
MKLSSLKALIIIAFPLITSCHHYPDLSIAPPRPAPPGPEFKCAQDTIYFVNSVLPIITTSCARSGCHDEASHKANHILDNYAGIIQLVTPFDPQGSKLYAVLFVNPNETMPPNNPLSLDQRGIIYWWIAQGAYNNQCDSAGCDSTNVTYTSSIKTIVSSWCVGCHGGSNPSNGLSLETYSEVVACAKSNRLMGALRHETGYYAMPKGGEMLSTCDINLFQKWINLGEPQ